MVIQRSWKIFGDAGSTSASSTEANRSPMGGLNSSSDDSNCSNQTTHSMVTSVASPPNVSAKTETSSVVVNSFNHSQIINNNQNQHQQPQTEAMKFITTPQMAELALQKLRQRFSNTTSLTNSSPESAMRSLELVRISVQSAFDKEINEMVKHFIESYFKPAFNNIKENLGQGAINDDAKMSCALLENAKSQYKVLRQKPQLSTTSTTITTPTNIIENSNIRMALKRPAPVKTTSTAIEMQKRLFTESQPLQQQQVPLQILPAVGTIKSTFSQNQHIAGSFSHQQRQHQTFQATATPIVTIPQLQAQKQQQQSHLRRQIFWNTAHISMTTKFVLDVQANQAFGFGTEGKERLASKHPELIRYLPDIEDRDWLITQQIIPQQNRHSRFLLLLYDEIFRLYQTNDVYKNKVSVDLSVMMTFTVPDFMIQKMKIFFVDLNIKSRGLITNSYSIGNATIQPTHQQSNSHLRNALLLGTPHSLPNSTVTVSNAATTSDSTSSPLVGSSSCSSSNITSTEQKTKSSNLSSSHATLTALLNNSSSSSSNTSPSTATLNEKCSASSVNSSTNFPASTASALLNKLRK